MILRTIWHSLPLTQQSGIQEIRLLCFSVRGDRRGEIIRCGAFTTMTVYRKLTYHLKYKKYRDKNSRHSAGHEECSSVPVPTLLEPIEFHSSRRFTAFVSLFSRKTAKKKRARKRIDVPRRLFLFYSSVLAGRLTNSCIFLRSTSLSGKWSWYSAATSSNALLRSFIGAFSLQIVSPVLTLF